MFQVDGLTLPNSEVSGDGLQNNVVKKVDSADICNSEQFF